MSVMLYMHPGKHKIHGSNFDYVIVEEDEVEQYLNKGYSKTTPEALEKSDAKKAKRLELEKKADERGIKYDGRTSTEKLEQLINGTQDELY